jgi:hypothetical protein
LLQVMVQRNFHNPYLAYFVVYDTTSNGTKKLSQPLLSLLCCI